MSGDPDERRSAGWRALREVRALVGQSLIALDFDGTLAPIQEDPSSVRLVDGALQALQDLARAGASIAIVTGRPVATLFELADLRTVPGLRIEALYGAERWAEGKLETIPTPPSMPAARAEAARLLQVLSSDDRALGGVWIEDKRINVVVHTRRTVDPEGIQAQLAGPIDELARRLGLEMHLGKDVLEIRLPDLDKGAAMRRLLSVDHAAAVFAGDDLGDIPALDAARDWGERTGRPVATISSGAAADAPVARHAQLNLAGPGEVVAALRTLLSN